MTTATLNLSLREGATYVRTLKWLDSRKRPINLTGATVTAQIRDKADGQLLIDLNVGNGGIAVNPTTGQITITFSAIVTAAISFTTAAWDLKVTFSDGTVRYLVGGRVTVTRSVTE